MANLELPASPVQVYVNGTLMTMPTSPAVYLQRDKAFVPFWTVCEALGCLMIGRERYVDNSGEAADGWNEIAYKDETIIQAIDGESELRVGIYNNDVPEDFRGEWRIQMAGPAFMMFDPMGQNEFLFVQADVLKHDLIHLVSDVTWTETDTGIRLAIGSPPPPPDPTAAEDYLDSIRVFVKGTEVDLQNYPTLLITNDSVKGTAMLPFVQVAEAFGATREAYVLGSRAAYTYNGVTLEYTAGLTWSYHVTQNGRTETRSIGEAPQRPNYIHDGYSGTYWLVPARSIADAWNVPCTWDMEHKTVFYGEVVAVSQNDPRNYGIGVDATGTIEYADTIPEYPKDELWIFRQDLTDEQFAALERQVASMGGQLSIGVGGSIILPTNFSAYFPKEIWDTALENAEKNRDNYYNEWKKIDPMKFSTAKYHGAIKNLTTGEVRKFQFNPETFEYSRGVTYSDSISPGMPYPETQYSHGEIRTFDVELFMYDPYCTGLIKEYMYFLGDFLTPETNDPDYAQPPEMLFYYAYFVRRCVLTNLTITHEWLDEQGTPLMTRYKLTLRQVGVAE